MTDQPERHHREVVSFTRRGGRLKERQQKAWDETAADFVLDIPRARTTTSVDPDYVLDPVATFGRSARLVVEIGSGRGESLVHAALEHPDTDFLALEVYLPGVAQTLVSMRHATVTNIRLAVVDAAPAFATMLPAGGIAEVRTWFPDPWHKKRHNKRRLVTVEFAKLVHRVLEPGGTWRLATDWADYADQMREVLTAAPEFDFSGTWSERFPGRPVTRFEAKGLAKGRAIFDLDARSRLKP